MISIDVDKRLGAFHLVAKFAGGPGIVALSGRSGSGKSTLVRLIAGLDRPDRGRIALGPAHVLVDTERGIFVPKHRRRIGLVFQDAQLFPHLTVRQNLLFGRVFAPRAARRVGFDAVVETLGVGHLLARRTPRLSGGERQRVAIGRALLACPHLLLMDEPLASLDDARKAEILPLIERLRDEFGTPIVYVSHAMAEVARLAQTVVLLDAGRVVAVGSPQQTLGLADPGDRFAQATVLDVTLGEVDAAYGLTALHHPAGTLSLPAELAPPGKPVRVIIHATDVSLATARPVQVSIRNVLAGHVAAIEPQGPALVAVRIALAGDGLLTASATRKAVDELALAPGKPVYALIKTVAIDERPLIG
ncbi:molybdenum ABC transporter ATP-binding protein [Chelatococcus reniformis]|uniref:Molybdenum import ATP-binding protein ModC n=1 Tax=Chelatococcus reniformis TaxID=1494448 RepID=A0A916UAQ9_9HYPH|nr:molybdenum ABC transporter ATP-binding protein [Chelatococcus reniformis]GGC66567.1 molybdenum import ATP-binding protein ModC [Chelatococcus reniformis]